MPLRKEPARGGTLRLIDVEGFDLSACGGTHVARTGGIGIIAVASWERFKGGQRLSFLCGGRALGGYRALRDAVSGAVRLLSVLPEELPASIERMQAEAKEQTKAMIAAAERARALPRGRARGGSRAHPADRRDARRRQAGGARDRRRRERLEGPGHGDRREPGLPRRPRVVIDSGSCRRRTVGGR